MHEESKIVRGSQLRKAREFLQLKAEEVAKGLNVSPQSILEWENESDQPNLKTLEALADYYGREIDYFLRETPPAPPNLEFRGRPGQTLRGLPQGAKLVLSKFDELCRSALEFEQLLNKPRKINLPPFKKADNPSTVARQIRDLLRAGTGPLRELRNLLEQTGVLIFELPVPDDSFSGLAFWHTDYGPSILINAKDSPGRRHFTLAHELAHLLYQQGSSLCYIPRYLSKSPKGLEHQANQFAIELLLPESAIKNDFNRKGLSRNPTEQELRSLAVKWSVSLQALGYRLENLDLITKGNTDQLIETRPLHARRPRIPTWERRVGTRFKELSIEAYKKNLISASKVAHTFNIRIRKAIEVLTTSEQ